MMLESELETMRKSFKTSSERTNQLMQDPKLQQLKKKVQEIRKNAIKNNKQLYEEAKKNLESNGIEVIYAKDVQTVQEKTLDLIKKYSAYDNLEDVTVIKAKSNTLREVGIEKYLNQYNINFVATDLGDRILQLKDKDGVPVHPTGPIAHLNIKAITDIINKSPEMDVTVSEDAHEIMQAVKKDVLDLMDKSDVGISGANCISAEEGSIVLVHNEGNINHITSKKLHIVVAGIDKLVPTLEDAISIAKLETVYATGKRVTSYMNIISGPSKTADIEKKLFKNMYGAENVVVFLLDNGRSKAFDECLWCIGCGNCTVSCPVYNAIGNEFGYNNYVGGRGVALSSFISDDKTSKDSGLFKCTLCGSCTENCPVSLPTNVLIEHIRANCNNEGIFLKPHEVIKEHIEDHDSPY